MADDVGSEGKGAVGAHPSGRVSGDVSHDTESSDRPRLRVHLLTRPEEAEAIVPAMAVAHAETPFGRYRFSAAKARQRVLATLRNPDRRAGFYATYDGRVVGLAEVAVGPHFLSEEGVPATCLVLDVLPDIRKSLLGGRAAAMLLRAMKAWARAKGAEMLTIHGTSGQMARMARGARPIRVNVVVPLGA